MSHHTRRRRSRASLLWLAAWVAGLQLGLAFLVETRRPELRDPEYAHKLTHLHNRLAESDQRPLVLMLGSSRVGVGVRPECFPAPPDTGRANPLLLNFALCGSGPFLERICLRRLLEDG